RVPAFARIRCVNRAEAPAEDFLDGRYPGVKPAANKKRILLTGIFTAALVLSAAGCFGGDKATGPSPSETASPSPSPVETGAFPAPAPSATAPSSGGTASPSQEPAQDVLTGTGSLVGLVDNHSVEIETEDGPAVFQISQEIRDRVENWDTGTKVR